MAVLPFFRDSERALAECSTPAASQQACTGTQTSQVRKCMFSLASLLLAVQHQGCQGRDSRCSLPWQLLIVLQIWTRHALVIAAKGLAAFGLGRLATFHHSRVCTIR